MENASGGREFDLSRLAAEDSRKTFAFVMLCAADVAIARIYDAYGR